MVVRRQCILPFLAALSLVVLSANIYFVYIIIEEKSSHSAAARVDSVITPGKGTSASSGKHQNKVYPKQERQSFSHRNATQDAITKIKKMISHLPRKYVQLSVSYRKIVNNLLKDLKPSTDIPFDIWDVADKWVGVREVLPEKAAALGSILHVLCSAKIVRADNAQRGTQLKLLFTLEGNHKAVFKPQWYSRDDVIDGPVYAGKDRHNAEVAAFHLSLLLGMRRSPLAVGRKVNLRSAVMPVASKSLLDTFYQEGNNTCLYGVCYYCSPQDPVCAHKDIMEGALILWLPHKLKKYRHPWQRTYKFDSAARWEVDSNYCSKVIAKPLYNLKRSTRILDLIDTAIFDFLIDNGDRHHYEVFENISNSMVLLLDNGKSFGHPKQDHLDILAPLYQCCMIRQHTWDRLKILAGGALSTAMEQLLSHSHIAPVLTFPHLHALDRRLLTVFAAVEMCFSQVGEEAVVWHDSGR